METFLILVQVICPAFGWLWAKHPKLKLSVLFFLTKYVFFFSQNIPGSNFCVDVTHFATNLAHFFGLVVDIQCIIFHHGFSFF